MPMIGDSIFEIPSKQTAQCVFDALKAYNRL